MQEASPDLHVIDAGLWGPSNLDRAMSWSHEDLRFQSPDAPPSFSRHLHKAKYLCVIGCSGDLAAGHTL